MAEGEAAAAAAAPAPAPEITEIDLGAAVCNVSILCDNFFL